MAPEEWWIIPVYPRRSIPPTPIQPALLQDRAILFALRLHCVEWFFLRGTWYIILFIKLYRNGWVEKATAMNTWIHRPGISVKMDTVACTPLVPLLPPNFWKVRGQLVGHMQWLWEEILSQTKLKAGTEMKVWSLASTCTPRHMCPSP